MKLTTTQEIPGFRIVAVHGLAEGSVVQSKHVGRDIAAGLKSLLGGEIRGYSEMLQEARSKARGRMKDAAAKQGANAIVGVRYTTSAIAQSMSELLAFGTAVTIVPIDA